MNKHNSSDDPESRNVQELNIESIIGPTHSFLGLSFGNIASMAHKNTVSHPKKACLESLKKMKQLHDIGVSQIILPPHERPLCIHPDETPQKIVQELPLDELQYRYSASSMWTANSGTITPSIDTTDHTLHITPANLISTQHRHYEAPFTTKLLQYLFPKAIHHPSLVDTLPDEGAANHTRLTPSHSHKGLHIFVYGTSIDNPSTSSFPARQSLEAQHTIQNTHQIPDAQCLFLQQSQTAINAGVFHNDVISTGNENVFLYHEHTFEDPSAIQLIEDKFNQLFNSPLRLIKIPESQLPLSIAVKSYLFNSQIVTLDSGDMVLIAPENCLHYDNARQTIYDLIQQDNPIKKVQFVNLSESMMNGGGPACLRLRALLNKKEQTQIPSELWFTESLYQDLIHWTKKYYRDQLNLNDLKDPTLIEEVHTALYELTKLLRLGSIYTFQR